MSPRHLQARAIPGVVLALVIGAGCLCALGLAVSGFIPNGQAAAPITNATYVPLAIVSGVFYPMDGVPNWLDFVVGLWLVAGVLIAHRTFRWDRNTRAA